MILVELDKPRRLRFDHNALSDADQALDHKLIHILNGSPIVLDTLRTLLWAGLKHEDPLMTVEKAGTLCDIWYQQGKSPIELAEKVSEALLASGVFYLTEGGTKNGG